MFNFGKSDKTKLTWSDLLQSSDAVLVAELQSGNDDAFAAIVDRYRKLVFSVALRIVKNESEAEDVVQSVFLEIYKKVGQFDAGRGTLKVWLLQYAYSRSINRRNYLEQRHFYTQRAVDEVDQLEFASGKMPHQGLSSSETGLLVRRALQSLNENQQMAIELVYFHGLTLEEAAEKSGETLSATRHHYYRGLLKMREFLTTEAPHAALKLEEAVSLGLEVQNLKPRPI